MISSYNAVYRNVEMWKCGSSTHIGDRCNNQGRTFDEIFNGSVTDETFSKPTWAAVVSSVTKWSDFLGLWSGIGLF